MTGPKPTIDLGYPTEPHGRIPAFANVEEEAAFWDTHDFTDFEEETWPVDVVVGAEFGERLTVRLDPDERQALARQARDRAMEPSTLATVWLKDRLRQERDKEAS